MSGFGIAPLKQEGERTWVDERNEPWRKSKADTPEQAALAEAMLMTMRDWRTADGKRLPIKAPEDGRGTSCSDINAIWPVLNGSPVQLAETLPFMLGQLGYEMTVKRRGQRKGWRFW